MAEMKSQPYWRRYPKQFWPLASDRTVLQVTAARAVGGGFAQPVVVCGEAHRFLVAE